MLAPFGIGLASGPQTHTPEFFATPVDQQALIAGTEFSTGTHFSRTLLYLHLSGRFTEAHRDLFERYLERPRPVNAGNRIFDWQQLAGNSGGSFDYVNPQQLVTRQFVRNGVQLTERVYIDNCMNDAFATAIATLNDRKERYGADSVAFARWLSAQQLVFSNCASVELILPAPPDDAWGPLERQDRRYQIAASYFYGLRYIEAAERFREIAGDSASPWSDVSRYLVARSLVREAETNRNDVEANLRAALELYRGMAADADYLEAYPSVTGLIRYIEIKLDTPEFMRRLAEEILERPGEVDALALDDFLYLVENGGFDSSSDGADEAALLRWHRLAASPTTVATNAFDERWQATGNPAWLYLALMRPVPPNEAATAERYRSAVATLDRATPGLKDMRTRLASVLAGSGDTDGARAIARAALDDTRLELEQKHRNTLQYLLALTSDDPIEFLSLARLMPVALRVTSSRFSFVDAAVLRQATRGAALLPSDAVRLVNDYFTPEMLLDAVDAIAFDDYLRGRLVISAWVKALLGGDEDSARRAAERLKGEYPSLEAELDQYLAGDNSEFVAARIILNHPGFSPWMPQGIGRYRSGGSGDDMVFPSTQVALGLRRYNWWCDETTVGARGIDVGTAIENLAQQPMFANLPSAQLAEMAQMSGGLQASATEFFGPIVIDYARANPDDPRVPHTLHRLVFATRYACRSGPGVVSQAAFALLHRDYPESEWTRETPYWFE